MRSKKYFFLFILIFFSLKNYATHIIGGEIYYDCLGNNDYRITLKVYRDCYNGIPPFDNPAYIFIFNSAGVFIDSIAMTLPGSVVLPPSVNNPCFTPPTNVCVEEAVYQRIINLPPIPGGYDLSYQRCCRNGTIVNLSNPGNVGTTYMAHINDSNLAPCNSSPRYNHFPPIFICAGVPLIFDHSAIDLDGDSLYYEFCDPFAGASSDCPSLGVNPGANCPIIAPPPPYDLVPWLPPYNAAYPMSASPAMNIDHKTGLLTGTPNQIGQWVVGVCVSEYRNGILLDVHKRDFQFNVVDCPNLPVASIPEQQTFCNGFKTDFTHNSLNAYTVHWDFGDPTTTLDTANIGSPTWVYADSGTYTVTLIINPGTICADTNTKTFRIYPLLKPKFIPPDGGCVKNNTFDFIGGGIYSSNATFNWNFGTAATPSTSSLKDPTGIIFNSAGTYPITFTITENGCTQSYTDTIVVYPKPIASIPTQQTFCNGYKTDFTHNSINAHTVHWDFGDPTTILDTANIASPTWVYADSGTYTVTLIINPGTMCADTNTNTFRIYPLLKPKFIPPAGECIESNSFDFTGGGFYLGNGTFDWNFGASATPSTSSLKNPTAITFNSAGAYPITFTITENGCTQSYTDTIIVYPKPIALFGLSTVGICALNPVAFIDSSLADTPLTYNWSFGDGKTSTIQNPTNRYQSAGTYNVQLIIKTQHGCKDTVILNNALSVYALPIAGFDVNPKDTSIFYPDITMIDKSQFGVYCTVSWGDGSNDADCNLTHNYKKPGTYSIMQIVVNEKGCPDTAYSKVIINPEFRFWIPNAFTPANADGNNDVFKPKLIGVHNYKLLIFNRWGQQIFATNDSDMGWDGFYAGQLCQQDVYVYKVIFDDDVKNKHHEYIGKVTLVK